MPRHVVLISRDAALASNRLARLAQVRINRHRLAPPSAVSISRKRGDMFSRIRKKLIPVSALVSG